MRHGAAVTAAVISVAAGGLVAATTSAGAAPGRHAPTVRAAAHPPRTIPAMRRWKPAAGRWQLGAHARVVSADRAPGVRREAVQLAHDLDPVVHRRLRVVSRVPAAPGDIVLDRRPVRGVGRQGYLLDVGPTLEIVGADRVGLFNGGRSVIQLLRQHQWIRHGLARDWPSYRERGLLVDCGRIAYSTRWVLREIRAMALLKDNLLHLHLTDDQRWGVASKAFPKVVSPRAFSYRDIRRILRVAHRYHVQVMPEIDMPGHMGAFLAVHPGLALQPLAGGSSSSQPYVTDKLDITRPEVRRDVKAMVLEYMKLFGGRYFDMGDDEVLPPSELALFPQLASYAIEKYGAGATPSDALHGFINWVDKIVRAHGERLRLWNDQLGGTVVVPVDNDVTVDWWTQFSLWGDWWSVSPRTLLAQGFAVVNSGWYPNYYASDAGPVAGKADPATVYRDWQVEQFDGQADHDGHPFTETTVPHGAAGLLGDAVSIWGPLAETPAHTARAVAPRLAVIAQKTWDTAPPFRSYARFARLMHRAGIT